MLTPTREHLGGPHNQWRNRPLGRHHKSVSPKPAFLDGRVEPTKSAASSHARSPSKSDIIVNIGQIIRIVSLHLSSPMLSTPANQTHTTMSQ